MSPYQLEPLHPYRMLYVSHTVHSFQRFNIKFCVSMCFLSSFFCWEILSRKGILQQVIDVQYPADLAPET